MATLSSVYLEVVLAKARSIVGAGIADGQLRNSMHIKALEWGLRALAINLHATSKQVSYDADRITSMERRIETPRKFMGFVSLEFVMADKIRRLLKTDFQHLSAHRPDWSGTSKLATMWAWMDSTTIAVNGTGNLRLTYVEEPDPVTALDEFVDPRLGYIDEMALVYLTCAYLKQQAGDAANMKLAAQFYQQSMSMAGVKNAPRMAGVVIDEAADA